ncbi:hypothetical protein HK099_004018 [Clydaea vesicula]|uniref:Uncharacterized protein n=1 Tax=Clydaea vesicula TaxID=447962 RepID=A0AAD5XVV8_9FUNG|nr:hypothetical protein HK099_004018 [Clydaea vesicula]
MKLEQNSSVATTDQTIINPDFSNFHQTTINFDNDDSLVIDEDSETKGVPYSQETIRRAHGCGQAYIKLAIEKKWKTGKNSNYFPLSLENLVVKRLSINFSEENLLMSPTTPNSNFLPSHNFIDVADPLHHNGIGNIGLKVNSANLKRALRVASTVTKVVLQNSWETEDKLFPIELHVLQKFTDSELKKVELGTMTISSFLKQLQYLDLYHKSLNLDWSSVRNDPSIIEKINLFFALSNSKIKKHDTDLNVYHLVKNDENTSLLQLNEKSDNLCINWNNNVNDLNHTNNYQNNGNHLDFQAPERQLLVYENKIEEGLKRKVIHNDINKITDSSKVLKNCNKFELEIKNKIEDNKKRKMEIILKMMEKGEDTRIIADILKFLD